MSYMDVESMGFVLFFLRASGIGASYFIPKQFMGDQARENGSWFHENVATENGRTSDKSRASQGKVTIAVGINCNQSRRSQGA